MQCPYCQKENFIPDYVIAKIECYGSSFVRFPCKYCNEVVKSYGSRVTRFEFADKTEEESDW